MSLLRLVPLLALLSLALRCQSVPLQLALRPATSAVSLSALPAAPGAAPGVALTGVVRICPADFPAGFTLSCASATRRARAAEFFADGRRVKVSAGSWYNSHVLAGFFRGGEVVWEGFATGAVVRCLTSDGDAAQIEIRLAC